MSRSDTMLWLIGGFKLLKGLVLLALAAGVLRLLRPDFAGAVAWWAIDLHEHRMVGRNVLHARYAAGAHTSSLSTRARYSPLMYCQRISVAWRTASMAIACRSGASE